MSAQPQHKEAFLNQKKHFGYDLLRDSHYQGSGMLDAAAPPVVAKPRPGASSIELGGGYAPEWNKESVAASQWTTTYGAANQATIGHSSNNNELSNSRRFAMQQQAQAQARAAAQDHYMTTNRAFTSGFAEDISDLQASAVGLALYVPFVCRAYVHPHVVRLFVGAFKPLALNVCVYLARAGCALHALSVQGFTRFSLPTSSSTFVPKSLRVASPWLPRNNQHPMWRFFDVPNPAAEPHSCD